MKHTMLTRLGAAGLAAATITTGLAFGPAAANAAESSTPRIAGPLTFKTIDAVAYKAVLPQTSAGNIATNQFSTLAAAQSAAATFTFPKGGAYGPVSPITHPELCLQLGSSDRMALAACNGSSAQQYRLTSGDLLYSSMTGATSRYVRAETKYSGVFAEQYTASASATVGANSYEDAFNAHVVRTDLHTRTAELAGLAAPNSTLILNDTISVPVGTDGKWTYTVTGLKLGKNTIKIEQFEGENNKTGEISVVADLQVSPIAAHSTFVADVTKPMTISGTAQAGANVEIWQGDMKLQTVPAAAVTGAFTADIAAPNAGGTQSYTLKQVIDGETAADTATVTADFGAQVSIVTPANDMIHDGGALRFQGRGVAGGKVELREQGKQGVIGTAPVLANGIWTIDAANIPGKKATYVATQTGKGNNVTTSAVTLNPDGNVTAPVVSPIAEGSNIVSGSGATPGSTIIVKDKDGKELGRDTVDEDGNWSVTVPPTLGPGTHDLDVVTVQDGETSDPTHITVDFGAAVVATSAVANAQGIVTYTGTGASGATVEVKGKSGVSLAGPVTVVDGKWTAVSTRTLPAGGYKVDVFQATGIGVKSSAEIAFTVAPSTATPVTFTGPANGSTAYTSKPTFSGKGQAGAKVEVGGTSKVIATTTVDVHGDWSVVSEIDLINGSYALQARQTPTNGAAPTIATNAFQIDASPAAPVVVTGPADGATVEGPRPVFTGTGAKGATVTVKGSVKAIATTTVDENGNWSVPASIDLGKGGYVLTVAQKALNGAESDTTVKFSIR